MKVRSGAAAALMAVTLAMGAGGCATATYGHSDDRGIFVPRGAGVQGQVDGPGCGQPQFGRACAEFQELSQVASSVTSYYQLRTLREGQVANGKVTYDGLFWYDGVGTPTDDITWWLAADASAGNTRLEKVGQVERGRETILRYATRSAPIVRATFVLTPRKHGPTGAGTVVRILGVGDPGEPFMPASPAHTSSPSRG